MKPTYEDCCNHGKDNYIGTVEVVESVDGKPKFVQYDVHLYDTTLGIHVCIRYGNEDNEYMSYPLIGFGPQGSKPALRWEVLCLINRKVDLSWEKRK